MNSLLTVSQRNGSRRRQQMSEGRNGHVNGRRVKKVAEAPEPPPKTWEQLLQEIPMGQINRLLMEKLIRYSIEANKKWMEAVELASSLTKPKLSREEKLKRFFSLNPFGCRNSKMIECLSILLDVEKESITPEKIDGDQSGDGAGDHSNLGFIVHAPPGSAIKVIGGRPIDRRNTINAFQDIFFRKVDDSHFYGRIIRDDGAQKDFVLSSLIERITPMPEHYRPATPEELVPVFRKLSLDGMQGLIYKIIPKVDYKDVLAEPKQEPSTRSSEPDPDEDSDNA